MQTREWYLDEGSGAACIGGWWISELEEDERKSVGPVVMEEIYSSGIEDYIERSGRM